MRTADAPGGVPGRGHLRPAAARGERPGPAGADRRRSLPSGRYRARELPRRRPSRMSALRVRAARTRSRRASRPRNAAWRATRSACWWPSAARLRSSTRTFDELPELLDPGDLLVVNVSATLPAAVSARRDGRLRGSGPFRDPGAAARRELAGRRAAHRRRRTPARGRAGEQRSGSRGGARRSSWSRRTRRALG